MRDWREVTAKEPAIQSAQQIDDFYWVYIDHESTSEWLKRIYIYIYTTDLQLRSI